MKTAFNLPFCAATADSYLRWSHGEDAYFRGELTSVHDSPGVHVLQSCGQLNEVLPAGSKRNNKNDHSKLWVSTEVIIIPTLSWTQDAFFWDHSSYSYFGIGITEYTEYQFPIKQIARYSENRIADVIRRDRRRREIFPPKYYSVHFCYREQNERHSIPFIPE